MCFVLLSLAPRHRGMFAPSCDPGVWGGPGPRRMGLALRKSLARSGGAEGETLPSLASPISLLSWEQEGATGPWGGWGQSWGKA